MPRAVAVVLAFACGCFIDRKSEELRCDTTGDCNDGRTCVNHYCVVGPGSNPIIDASNCPVQCTSCNAATKSCTINGNGNAVTCPIGWSCNITCSTPNACREINCGTSPCNVTCSAGNACRDITCQTGACTVMCTATNACGNISCGVGRCNVTCGASNACSGVMCPASCACDVACPAGNCGNNSCPVSGINPCTSTGLAGAPCSSTFVSGCARC